MSYDPHSLLENLNWFIPNRYGDNVAAQLEYHFKELAESDPKNSGVVDVDLQGRVTSTFGGARGKAFAAGTGTKCK